MKRLVSSYIAISVIVMNLVVLVLLVELTVRATDYFEVEEEEDDLVNPIIAEREIVQINQVEYVESAGQRYHAYAIWRRDAFKGETLNIGDDGLRATPGAECGPNSYNVYAFGGSAMWGVGAADWETIPAILQERLSESMIRPVCVVNFAQNGYVARQNLAALLTELLSDRKPDFVIFYDGFNDVTAGFRNGDPAKHFGFHRVVRKFERTSEDNYRELVSELVALDYLRDVLESLEFEGEPEETEEEAQQLKDEASLSDLNISERVADYYVAIYGVVDALSKRWDFDYGLFLQPIIWLGEKPLTEQEKFLSDTFRYYSSELADVIEASYEQIRERSLAHDNLIDVSGAFDEEESDIWYDLVHVSGDGNRIVADRMLQFMMPKIEHREAVVSEDGN